MPLKYLAPRYLSATEAMVYLGISRQTFYRMKNQWAFPVIVFGDKKLYDTKDLDEAMSVHKIGKEE